MFSLKTLFSSFSRFYLWASGRTMIPILRVRIRQLMAPGENGGKSLKGTFCWLFGAADDSDNQ